MEICRNLICGAWVGSVSGSGAFLKGARRATSDVASYEFIKRPEVEAASRVCAFRLWDFRLMNYVKRAASPPHLPDSSCVCRSATLCKWPVLIWAHFLRISPEITDIFAYKKKKWIISVGWLFIALMCADAGH